MANFDNSLKHTIERLFDMCTGYVLDFTNATFADFVETSVGFDPYTRYQGSKATILRSIWQHEPDHVAAKVTSEMVERWRTDCLMSGSGFTPSQQAIFDDVVGKLAAFMNEPAASSGDLAFLERDYGAIDLGRLQVPLTSQQVIQQRLDEIDRCVDAQAPLAVIFLCGSTLEGLLSEVALAQQSAYLASSSAPRRQGRVRPIDDWTLANLITVSHEQGVVGVDVVKHADAVRDFRNYIHPRQQLRENFTPRMVTAEIARQVVLATIADLSGSSGLSMVDPRAWPALVGA